MMLLVHITGLLITAAPLGIYQISQFIITGDQLLSLDGILNQAFGLFISLWSVRFVATWKRIESRQRVIWGVDDLSKVEKQGYKASVKFDRSSKTTQKENLTILSGMKLDSESALIIVITLFLIAAVIYIKDLIQNVYHLTGWQNTLMGLAITALNIAIK